MLNSLYIKNYRNLREFKINSLEQVNLITGKNNTGKSALLEAISIYASRGDIFQIRQLLEDRGEDIRQSDSENILASNVQSFSSMFTDRKIDFNNKNTISIGQPNNSVVMRFVQYQDEEIKDKQGHIFQQKRIISDEDERREYTEYNIGFEIAFSNLSRLFSLDSILFPHSGDGLFPRKKENFQFIQTKNINRKINEQLFDSIALTEKEGYVIKALKIIEPDTEKIAFRAGGEYSTLRIPVVKLSSVSEVLPLQSMGDGMNRILTIILALVSSDNGFLLIDEFENGLHYTVQEQLWKIIFELSESLNIQVFATTHSEDCISGFQSILNNSENPLKGKGKLIRLDNVNGEIKPVEYSPSELKTASDHNIETR
ncbi:ATP/GTP phosphatase [termite gut metagenome]|uniref:ATP/GTP phosphatase n=1 Tax=termite gut metagenome TaxID=433724 RepID=A0A5J4RQ78_9ZZZZ